MLADKMKGRNKIMAEKKQLDVLIEKACASIKAALGAAIFDLYQASTHRSVVATVAVRALIEESAIEKAIAPECFKAIYAAFAKERTLLEHSNFKQNRLAPNGIIPESTAKPVASAVVAPEFD